MKLRIGTRASKLAMTQAEKLRDTLLRANPALEITLHPMTTAGDKDLQAKLTDWGFKGLFTKELEDGLLTGDIDIAVHSMKDMPSILPDGLIIGNVLERDDPRDAWISSKYASLAEMPNHAVVGSSSIRRIAQLKIHYPHLKVVEFRGNVQTRLQKLDDGVADGTFLACAGLDRMSMGEHIRERIAPEIMLPAAAQGIIATECRADNRVVRECLAQINHAETMTRATCERAMLLTLDGSCRTAIAGLSTIEGGTIHLRAQVLAEDGSEQHSYHSEAALSDAEALGNHVGEVLAQRAGHLLKRNIV
ncbi:MAG: hydroxymethylbilane synthase [Alphaproteobacteria bacterium]|nr:hydroxymethylbilane synthase [Alphaproteobacteria bacterium]